jgi:hypothetical protein
MKTKYRKSSFISSTTSSLSLPSAILLILLLVSSVVFFVMYSNDFFINDKNIITVTTSSSIIIESYNPRIDNSKFVDIKKYIYSTSKYVQELDNTSYVTVINDYKDQPISLETAIIIFYAPWYDIIFKPSSL